MKKIIIFTLLLSIIFLSGCKNKNKNIEPEEEYYTVTQEEYNQNCNYSEYVKRLTSLNFTVEYYESSKNKNYHYITKFDNGKVMSDAGYGEFYCDFKEGTYNDTNSTWSFDGYFEENGIMKKYSYENEEMPDDIYLPDVGYIVGYDEVKYNSGTTCYDQITDSKTLNLYYVYSEVKIRFVNGNIVNISYNYESTTNPGNVYSIIMIITDYNKTIVTLPNV